MLFGKYLSALATSCAALTGSSSSATCVAQYQSPEPRPYLELPRAGRRDRVPGVMAVHPALQFREELQQIFIWVHGSPFLAAAVLSTAARFDR